MFENNVFTAKESLEHIYRKHHIQGKRYGYLYSHGARGPYLKNWIGKGKKILDLGCRDGTLTRFFAEGNDVIGVDIDRYALEIAQEKLKIKTLWMDLNQEFISASGEFDVVVACEVMEHIFFTEPFLENIFRVLKPGGIFIGSVPNAFRLKNRIKFLFGKEFETDATHVHMYSHDSLSRLLKRRFSHPEIIAIQGKILPFLSVSSYTPRKLNYLFGRDLLWKTEKEK